MCLQGLERKNIQAVHCLGSDWMVGNPIVCLEHAVLGGFRWSNKQRGRKNKPIKQVHGVTEKSSPNQSLVVTLGMWHYITAPLLSCKSAKSLMWNLGLGHLETDKILVNQTSLQEAHTIYNFTWLNNIINYSYTCWSRLQWFLSWLKYYLLWPRITI